MARSPPLSATLLVVGLLVALSAAFFAHAAKPDSSISWYKCTDNALNPYPRFDPTSGTKSLLDDITSRLDNDVSIYEDDDNIDDDEIVSLLQRVMLADSNDNLSYPSPKTIISRLAAQGLPLLTKMIPRESMQQMKSLVNSVKKMSQQHQYFEQSSTMEDRVRAHTMLQSVISANSLASSSAAGAGGAAAEKLVPPQTMCAKIKVPLRWDNNDDERLIDFFVKKYPARVDPAKRIGQVWLQQGGPGFPGDVFDPYAPVLYELLDGAYDIIVPDHRGTGRSELLTCSVEPPGKLVPLRRQKLMAQCMEEIKKRYDNGGWKGFTTTNAAHDIIHVIDLVKKENKAKQSALEKVVFYGVSYGTHVLNRILQLNPVAVDVAIADGMVAQKTFDFFQWDRKYDQVGAKFLDKCKDDAFCNAKFEDFGSTVRDAMHRFYKKITDSKSACFSAEKGELVRMFMSSLLSGDDRREAILPLVFREIRCNAQDRVILDNFSFALSLLKLMLSQASVDNTMLDGRGGPRIENHPPTEVAYPSYALMRLIVANELVDRDYLPDAIKDITGYMLSFPPFFGNGDSGVFVNATLAMEDTKALFTEDKGKEYRRKYAKYDYPMLMIQGDLDPQTVESDAREWQSEFTQPEQHWVEFPNSAHGVMIRSVTTSGEPCAMKIVADFIKRAAKGEDMTKAVDISCTIDTLDAHLNWRGTNRTYPFKLFGHTDLWEGAPWASFRTMATLSLVAIIAAIALALLCCCCCCVCSCVGLVVCLRRRAAQDKHYNTLNNSNNPAMGSTFAGVQYAPVDTEEEDA